MKVSGDNAKKTNGIDDDEMRGKWSQKNFTRFIVDVTTFLWASLKNKKTWIDISKSIMEKPVLSQIVAHSQNR